MKQEQSSLEKEVLSEVEVLLKVYPLGTAKLLADQKAKILRLLERELNCKYCTNECHFYRNQESKCIIKKEFEELM